MRLPGGRQAQPGVATGHNVLAWRLGYAEVFKAQRGRFNPLEQAQAWRLHQLQAPDH